MTDCGELKYFLGVKVQRNRPLRSLTLSQAHFVDQILHRFGMSESKPVATPLDTSVKLKTINKDDSSTGTSEIDTTLFRQIIGSLMYLMIGTRPDLAAAVSIISQYASNPTDEHLRAAKRVLRYLRGTSNYKLRLGLGSESKDQVQNLRLSGYSDANWGNDVETRRSTSGYVFYLNDGLISWSSKKQGTVALSTTEAEYMALAHTTKEAMWLRTLLSELGFDQGTTIVYEDNQSCIAMAKNPVHHARSKHIDIQHHFVREKVESGDIEVVYLPTEDMVADALTKPLPHPKFGKLVGQMGLYT